MNNIELVVLFGLTVVTACIVCGTVIFIRRALNLENRLYTIDDGPVYIIGKDIYVGERYDIQQYCRECGCDVCRAYLTRVGPG